jgi:SAM-dependent methyltransferase
MGFLSVISCAHRLAASRIRPGDAAVDATVGTGADTAFLCRAVGAGGIVYGFDIQQEALDRAAQRLAREPGLDASRVRFFLRSHAELRDAVPEERRGRISAIMFNLGYLPGGDQEIITRPESTIPALEAAIALLRPGGIVTAVLYPGHPGGREEAEAVERWASLLPESQFQTIMYRFLNRSGNPPYVIAVEKKSE